MNRLTCATILLAAFVLTSLSCSRGSAPSGTQENAAGTAQQAAQNTAVPAADPLDPKVLITDDKISRYIIYQRETNTVADLVLSAAGQAYKKSGGDQKGFEKELSQDARTKKIADVQASALSKSGLGQMEAIEISKIVATYTAGATMGDDAMKKTAKDEFSSKYGAAALAIMEKNLPELSKLQDEMLSAAFGKKK
jgi:hypothetical protein